MSAELRDLVRSRAGGRCEYCQLPDNVQILPFHVEHIVAKQHSGGDEIQNRAWSCDRCNAYKGPNLSSIDPDSGKVVELFHPRRDQWTDHFAISNGEIRGLSPCGRATVRLLQMNSRRRVELRMDLQDLGLIDE
jgi:hypothetical protein